MLSTATLLSSDQIIILDMAQVWYSYPQQPVHHSNRLVLILHNWACLRSPVLQIVKQLIKMYKSTAIKGCVGYFYIMCCWSVMHQFWKLQHTWIWLQHISLQNKPCCSSPPKMSLKSNFFGPSSQTKLCVESGHNGQNKADSMCPQILSNTNITNSI